MEQDGNEYSPEGRRVLVTGGAGYLGSILIPKLLDEGYKVHVLDRFYFGRQSLAKHEGNPNLEITNLDIFHHENISNLFKGVDAVIHLASISNDPSSDLDPNLTIQTNFLATISLARRAKSEGVKRFVFISSCSVYGASEDKVLDETSPAGPVTLYALSKLQCEDELLPLADDNFSVTVLRFATLFGYSPRMRFDLAINVMAKRALQRQSIIINGDGRQYRPFLHVADAARSIMHIIKSDRQKVNKKIYNVGNNEMNFMIKDLAKKIHDYFKGSELEVASVNNDRRSYNVSFGKFEEECGFKTQFKVEDGLREIEEACKKGLLPNMENEIYYNVPVMKKAISTPIMTYSLASTPRWETKESLIQSK